MFVLNSDAERADASAARKEDPAALLMRLLVGIEGRDADQGEHVNGRQRLAGGRCNVPEAFRRVAGRCADDRRRRAIQPCGGIQTNAHFARPQATRQSVDELLHSACRRHHALPRRSRGRARAPNTQRRAQARRVAGVHALERRTEEPPGRPDVPSHAHPIASTVSSGRGRRDAPCGRRREARGEREPLARVQRQPPGSVAVDVPSAA